MHELAIIIVSFNTRKHLEACLRSLHEPPVAVSHEVVVVDNGSTDDSVETVRSGWPHVRLIETGENLGYARANNRAIRATDSELILLLNSDAVVPPGGVDTLVDELRTHPDVAVVGPRLVDVNRKLELSFGSMISPLNEARQKLKGVVLARQLPFLSTWVARSASRPHHPEWVSGACLLVHRADAEAVGLLDERFFLYGEDVDFCAAVRKLGRRLLFVPTVEVVHDRGQSGAGAPLHTRAAYRRSQLAFYAKYHPAWVPLLRLYLWTKGQMPSP